MESEASLIDDPILVIEKLWRNSIKEKSQDILEKIRLKDPRLADALNIDIGALLSEKLLHLEKQIPDVTYIKSFSQLRALNQKIVKMRMMVQNIFDPEIFSAYFLKNNENIKEAQSLDDNLFSLKFRDDEIEKILPSDYDMENCLLVERDCLIGIPVPGESAWVENLYNNGPIETMVEGEKILKEFKGMKINVNADLQEIWPLLRKSGIVAHDTPRLPVLAKIYNAHRDTVRLNETVEITGILSFPAPSTEAEHESMNEETSGFYTDLNSLYPIDFVPRLHALSLKKINSDNYSSSLFNKEAFLPATEFPKEYEKILKLLNQLTQEDDIVSQFLLFGIMARCKASESANLLGKLVLNIYKVKNTSFLFNDSESPLGFSQALQMLFQQLLPKTEFLQLNLKTLHERNFKSVMSQNKPGLESGSLQLTDGTVLLIDETKMEAGSLNEFALNNLKAINDLLEFQKTKYNFVYFETELSNEIPAIILSEGKSFLKHDLGVPLLKDGIIKLPDSLINVLRGKSDDFWNLENLRKYLIRARENVNKVQIAADVAKMIEEDYISERKGAQPLAGKKTVDSDDLHVWINIGKMLSALKGEESLSIENYLKAKELELKRLGRV